MNMTRILAVVTALTAAAAGALTLSVTDVKMAQRYPWSGLVDIDYTVNCDNPDADIWVYPVGYDADFNTSIAPRTLEGAGANGQPVKAGTHRMTWNMAADMPENWNRAAVSVKVHAYAGAAPYLVVDLSGGPDAESWPVSYLTEMPDEEWPVEYKTTKLVLKLVAPGEFMMGSPVDDIWHDYCGVGYETQHKVTLTQPFYMGVFEVTQKQYLQMTGKTPNGSSYAGDMRPVSLVSYNDIRGTTLGAAWPVHRQVDADSFLGIFRAKTGVTFDLPTEAQWEYACRAGTGTPYNNGTSDEIGLAKVARYNGNASDGKGGYNGGPTSVGSYVFNAWGFYDMHGNVSEWCLDWWQNTLTSSSDIDPKGADSGVFRITRGGSVVSLWAPKNNNNNGWSYLPALRSGARNWSNYRGQSDTGTTPGKKDSGVGFRLVALPAE